MYEGSGMQVRPTPFRQRRRSEQGAGVVDQRNTLKRTAPQRLRNLPQRPGSSAATTSSTSTSSATAPVALAPTLNQATMQHQQAILESLQSSVGSGSVTMGSSSLGPTASATATTAPTLAAAPVATEQPAADEKTQEISALLQQANAMLNKLTRLQAIQVATGSSVEELIVQMQGLGFSDEERMALLDSGASHAYRSRTPEDDRQDCRP